MHTPTDPHTSTTPPTPASASQPTDFAAYQHRLLQLAVADHLALDARNDQTFAYQLGHRDALARAYGLLRAGAAPEATAQVTAAADKVIRALERGVIDPAVIRDIAVHDPAHVPDRPAGFAWIGPKAFERIATRYKGIDDDLGMLWGPRHDVRISLRASSDARTGLLYAFDPTWDEYAVLVENARIEHAVATFQLATAIDPHMDPARFLQIYQHVRALEPATPARQPDGIGVRR